MYLKAPAGREIRQADGSVATGLISQGWEPASKQEYISYQLEQRTGKRAVVKQEVPQAEPVATELQYPGELTPQQQRQNEAIRTLEPYTADGQVDLIKVVADGEGNAVNAAQLLYGEKRVKEAWDVYENNRRIEQLQPYTKDGEVDLTKLVTTGSRDDIAAAKELYGDKVGEAERLVSNYQALKEFTENNTVDLIEVVKSDNPKAIKAATELYGKEVVEDAEYKAKIPVTRDAWRRAGVGTRKNLRIVKPITLQGWNNLPEDERWEYYIKSQGVSGTVYGQMGEGTRRYFHPELTTLERFTTWKEEEGEQPSVMEAVRMTGVELGNIAADMIPFVEQRHDMPTYERAANLLLDLTIVGGIAAGISRGLARGTGRAATRIYGNKGGKAIVDTVDKLNTAVKIGDVKKVKSAGREIAELGKNMKAQGIVGGEALVQRGKMIQRKAASIAKGEIKAGEALGDTATRLKGFIKQYPYEVARGFAPGPTKIETKAFHRVLIKPKEATQITQKQLKTLDAKDVGMDESQFQRFIKHRVERDPKISPEEFKNIDKFQQAKSKKMWELIEEAMKSGKTPAEVEKLQKQEWLEKVLTERFGKNAPQIMERLKRAAKTIEKGKELRGLTKGEAAEIVRKAKENDKRIMELARKAIENIKKMRMPHPQSLTGVVTTSLWAVSSRSALKWMESLTATERELALSKLSPGLRNSVKKALETSGATQTKALAKTKTQAKSDLQAITTTEALTDSLAATKAEAKTLTEAVTETLFEPATELATETATMTTEEIITATSEELKQAPKRGRKGGILPFVPLAEASGIAVKDIEGAIGWYMGRQKTKGETLNVYHTIFYTRDGKLKYVILKSKTPPKELEIVASLRDAETSLVKRGKMPKGHLADVGIMDLISTEKTIKFRQDKQRRTKGRVSAKEAEVVTAGRIR